MKKTTASKLTLSRETLRQLTAEQANEALGGYEYAYRRYTEPPPTSDSERICCA